jgi:hypothetical protein
MSSYLSTFRKLTARSLIIGLVAIMAYIPFHAFFSVSVGALTHAPLLVKSWKEILLGLLGLLALGLVLADKKLLRDFMRSRINLVALAFIALHLLLVPLSLSHGVSAIVAGLAIDIRMIIFFLLIRLALQVNPNMWRYLVKAFVIGGVIVIGFGVLQQYILPADILSHVGYSKATISPYLTVDKNPNFIRINSTLRGPNPLGAYCILTMTMALAWLISGWKKLATWQRVILIVSILGSLSVIYASYSRSAWVGLAAALVVLGLLYVPKKFRTVVLASVVVVAVILGGSYVATQNSNFVQTIIRHKDPLDPTGNDSDIGHLNSLQTGLQQTLKQPLGAGIGSTGSASLLGDSPQIVENQYLFVTHEAGWLGLGLCVWLISEIIYRLYQGAKTNWQAKAILASGAGLLVAGLFLPIFADDTIAYVWWGLAAAMTAVALPGTIRNDRG